MDLKQIKQVYLGLVMVSSGYLTYKLIDKKVDVLLDDLDEVNTSSVLKAFTFGAGEAGISMAVGIVTGAIVNTIL